MEKAQHRHDISDRAWEILELLLCISLQTRPKRKPASYCNRPLETSVSAG